MASFVTSIKIQVQHGQLIYIAVNGLHLNIYAAAWFINHTSGAVANILKGTSSYLRVSGKSVWEASIMLNLLQLVRSTFLQLSQSVNVSIRFTSRAGGLSQVEAATRLAV